MDGLDALAAVQSRIAAIAARFSPPAVGVLGAAGAPTAKDPSTASTGDFASLLGGVSADGSTSVDDPSAVATTGGAIPAGGDMRSSAARLQFAHDLLTRIGAPQTAQNLHAIVAWQQAEGTRAAFNPLATTRSSGASGETNFNSVGVKNFPTYATGLATTIAALRNGLYGPILAALQRGDSAEAVGQAVASSRWGTGQAMLRALATTST